MPQPKIYGSRSEQQAAYRLRVKRSQEELLLLKKLPPLPAIPTVPGYVRWTAMAKRVEQWVTTIQQEMDNYYSDRSEVWQESEKGAEFQEKLELLDEILTLVQALT